MVEGAYSCLGRIESWESAGFNDVRFVLPEIDVGQVQSCLEKGRDAPNSQGVYVQKAEYEQCLRNGQVFRYTEQLRGDGSTMRLEGLLPDPDSALAETLSLRLDELDDAASSTMKP